MKIENKAITEKIIGGSFEVFRKLGYGFLEKVYQRAMKIELELRGLKVEIEKDIQVQYKGEMGFFEGSCGACSTPEMLSSQRID